MATALVIAEERGTCSGEYHQHNGYYAGDFFGQAAQAQVAAAPLLIHAG